MEVDERHVIARRFFQRCGFQLEAVLRKHRIVHNRNSNTALYVLLNSDWVSIEAHIRKSIGLEEVDKAVKAAALPTAIDKSNLLTTSAEVTITKKKRRNKKKAQQPQ